MSEYDPIIDKIEEIRSHNNTLWMDIVRLVMRVAPKEARKIFARIEANDQEITKLTSRLGQ